ncbi:MAG: YqgE/AlgH family protein [Bryobacteraceae bacterium]
MRRSLTILAAIAGIFLPLGSAAAGDFELLQSTEQDLRAGSLLVATEKLGDPAFAKSVILIVSRDNQGTIGLMINRRTDVPLSKIFPERKRAGSDPVYIGGPVELTLVQALLRSPSPIREATRVIGAVYSTSDKDVIERNIDSRASPSKFRMYLGYAGWGPGQLESEIRLGAWSVETGSAGVVFDSHPDSLWARLNARLHMQIVERLRPLAAGAPMVR